MGTNKVRISAKAIIIQEGRLLVLKNRDSAGEWYTLPGGGQEHGETLVATLQRECVEEIGSGVIVGRLRFIRDYIARHHEFAATEDDAHQVELMFECRVTSVPTMGTSPDPTQTGIEWLDLSALADHRLYPKVLKELLVDGVTVNEPTYLGDVN
jgi:8-oxo-dGTP diphosphatase